MSKLETRGTGVGWIICLRTNSQNEVIGSVRINRIEKKARCGVIGYELHPDYWSNGYATEALGKVVNYAHNQNSLNRLEAWTCEGNDASDKVLLNNGFQYEGTQRDKAMLRGSYKNIRLYGRLASDQLTNR